jgi:AbrB family looped-hinge helix DNA binding protein
MKSKMGVATVRVSDKGQIAIPRSIREMIGIEKGDELILFHADNRIMIEKADFVTKRFQDDFKDMTKHSESSLKKIWNNKEDDIWQKHMKR